jgi:hypothetical protein
MLFFSCVLLHLLWVISVSCLYNFPSLILYLAEVSYYRRHFWSLTHSISCLLFIFSESCSSLMNASLCVFWW